jgi:hypothetical protein
MLLVFRVRLGELVENLNLFLAGLEPTNEKSISARRSEVMGQIGTTGTEDTSTQADRRIQPLTCSPGFE